MHYIDTAYCNSFIYLFIFLLFLNLQLEEDPFNPDYVEVERVLDVSELPDPNTGKTIKHYLVKWRALQYEDSTWELQDDVDPAKIEQFERFNKLPSKEQLKVLHISKLLNE